MKCPICTGRTKVVRSVPLFDGEPCVIRQRKCESCGHTGNTTEKFCKETTPSKGEK